MFANRFTILHPKRVLAVAIGSPGGWPIATTRTWKGNHLRYPVGGMTSKDLIGKTFDLESYKAVSHFFYLGENDDNDSVPFADGYDPADRDLVFELFGQYQLIAGGLLKRPMTQQGFTQILGFSGHRS